MTEAEKGNVEDFRDWMAKAARLALPVVGTTRKVDGEGRQGDSLSLRLYTDTRTWLEVSILPAAAKLRVGLATESRVRNEEGEQLIEDSKETMDGFLELGLADAGYEDELYSMEHFHDSGIFYFASHLDLPHMEGLNSPELRERAKHLLEGYATAFEEIVEDR